MSRHVTVQTGTRLECDIHIHTLTTYLFRDLLAIATFDSRLPPATLIWRLMHIEHVGEAKRRE